MWTTVQCENPHRRPLAIPTGVQPKRDRSSVVILRVLGLKPLATRAAASKTLFTRLCMCDGILPSRTHVNQRMLACSDLAATDLENEL